VVKFAGPPQLNSFGPDFVLARELLATNEFDTVIEFLDSVGTFWANPEQRTETNAILVATRNRQTLDSWTQQIRDHKIPNDPKWR
jgi:hypothetical protein